MIHIPSHILKPARYVGIEPNVPRKDPGSVPVRFALCYPDLYEVGMSYYGHFLLYGLANTMPGVLCERVYAPWHDMEMHLRENGLPLCTLETQTPISRMDMVGFSMTYELNITNVLNMLDLGGIPLRAARRGQGVPVVIAGGPLTLNPKPFEAFFDLIVIGEGEDVLRKMLETAGALKGAPRQEIVETLAMFEGVYSPVLGKNRVRRQYVADLDASYHPTRPPIPVVASIHNRLNIEVSRGCGNGCRFCLAGYGYRPYRERSFENVKDIIDRSLAQTGYEEVSLLSLTAGDYGSLFETIGYVREHHRGVSVSLPSLKIGSIGEAEIGLIGGIARTGFTFALEAATPELRSCINKKIDTEELTRHLPLLREWGWRKLKLYLMTGFPWETPEDVAKMKEIITIFMKQNMDINLSVSPFTPKPQTPFQWLPMDSAAMLHEKIGALRGVLPKRVKMKLRDVRTSRIEAVIARGDERFADLFEYLHDNGVKLEAWREYFRPELYDRWFEEKGIDMEACLGSRDIAGILPWDFIDTGIDKEFLRDEYTCAEERKETVDCYSGCATCGLGCREGKSRPETPRYDPIMMGLVTEKKEPVVNGPGNDRFYKYTFRYRKCGDARTIGHIDATSILLRAIRAAGITMRMHGKYHPMPKVSFTEALSVGIESTVELVEIETKEPVTISRQLIQSINSCLPRGMQILEGAEVHLRNMVKEPAYMVISGSETEIEGLFLVRKRKKSVFLWKGKSVKELRLLGTFERIIKVDGKKMERWLQNLLSM